MTGSSKKKKKKKKRSFSHLHLELAAARVIAEVVADEVIASFGCALWLTLVSLDDETKTAAHVRASFRVENAGVLEVLGLGGDELLDYAIGVVVDVVQFLGLKIFGQLLRAPNNER